MTHEQLTELAELEAAASAAPWFVRELSDNACMSAVAVSMAPRDAAPGAFEHGAWPERDMIAACLLQSPAYVVPHDGRYDTNALLIARMRNALPELLRLAAMGQEAERNVTVA